MINSIMIKLASYLLLIVILIQIGIWHGRKLQTKDDARIILLAQRQRDVYKTEVKEWERINLRSCERLNGLLISRLADKLIMEMNCISCEKTLSISEFIRDPRREICNTCYKYISLGEEERDQEGNKNVEENKDY